MNPLRSIWRYFFADDDRPPAPDDLVIVAVTSDGLAVAEMWKGMLESAGIRAMAKDRTSIPLHVNLGYGPGVVEVYVRRGDIERAQEILAFAGEDVEAYDPDRASNAASESAPPRSLPDAE